MTMGKSLGKSDLETVRSADDPLVDIAVKIAELTALFVKHNLVPPEEISFAMQNDYYNFLMLARTSKRLWEIFDEGGDVYANPSSSKLMGIRLTYKTKSLRFKLPELHP